MTGGADMTPEICRDSEYMRVALDEARAAFAEDEVPVGAVIVRDGRIIARAHNRRENGKNAAAHAELLCIESACGTVGSWRLSGCTLYVTLEPCPMCAGAAINARLDRVVFALKDAKAGAFGSVLDLNSYPLNHRLPTESGLLGDESAALLREFFGKRR